MSLEELHQYEEEELGALEQVNCRYRKDSELGKLFLFAVFLCFMPPVLLNLSDLVDMHLETSENQSLY